MTKPLLLLTVAVTLAAQNQPSAPGRPVGPPPSFDALREYLSLTDSKAAQLRQLLRTRSDTNRSRFDEMAAKRRQADEMLRSGTADPATLGRLLLEVENERKQVRTADEASFAQAAAILNEQQRARLQALEEAAKLQKAVFEARTLGLIKTPEGMPGPLPRHAALPRLPESDDRRRGVNQ